MRITELSLAELEREATGIHTRERVAEAKHEE
jgi:hypothetical protein